MIAPSTETRRTVLVIDDELGPRESIRILLKNEFDVLCADGVDQGLGMLREHEPELVIMDIRMPGKTGIQGLRELRGIDTLVSVVMLTGFGALETAQQALRLGANDYINKPFDTNEMRQVARRYTQRTEVERKRVRMLGELHSVNDRLVADMASKERLASLGQASVEFAHDIRNPLMIVSGYVELLTRQLDHAREMMGETYDCASSYMDVIGANIRRCCDLVNSWRLAGKNQAMAMAPTRLSEVLDDMTIGVDPLASTENVHVDYDVQAADAVVHGNRLQLLRALHNLTTNAVHAVAKDSTGWVRISARPSGEGVEIEVKDNGCGMTPEVQARIFEPYFTTKTDGKGTGLGLAITRKIIEEHGGSIEVLSAPGSGTTITVRLPLAAAPKPAVLAAPRPDTVAVPVCA